MSLNIIKLRKLLIFNNLKYLRLFSTGKETHFGYENVSEEEKGDRGKAKYNFTNIKYFTKIYKKQNVNIKTTKAF